MQENNEELLVVCPVSGRPERNFPIKKRHERRVDRRAVAVLSLLGENYALLTSAFPSVQFGLK